MYHHFNFLLVSSNTHFHDFKTVQNEKILPFVSIRNLVVIMVACIFLYIIYIYNIILYVGVASKKLTL